MADERFEGKTDQMKGKAKEYAGKVTGDEDTEAEGKAENLKGKAKETYGDLKDKVKDATN